MKRAAPAVARNRQPILDVLTGCLPVHGLVLEIASGTGEHAAYLAEAFPALTFQPSDADADARASIDAWRENLALANLHPALALDASSPAWPIAAADAVLCINMIHISPWAATQGLIAGAGRILPPGGLLYLYGPYRRAGIPTAPSNDAFDADLRRRNPAWGLRNLEDVVALAEQAGLRHAGIVAMPANNLSVIFHRI